MNLHFLTRWVGTIAAVFMIQAASLPARAQSVEEKIENLQQQIDELRILLKEERAEMEKERQEYRTERSALENEKQEFQQEVETIKSAVTKTDGMRPVLADSTGLIFTTLTMIPTRSCRTLTIRLQHVPASGRILI